MLLPKALRKKRVYVSCQWCGHKTGAPSMPHHTERKHPLVAIAQKIKTADWCSQCGTDFDVSMVMRYRGRDLKRCMQCQ